MDRKEISNNISERKKLEKLDNTSKFRHKDIGSTGLTKGFLNSAVVMDENIQTGKPNSNE